MVYWQQKKCKLAKILQNYPKKLDLDQNINDTNSLIWSFLSVDFRFSGRFSKPTKTSNKDLSHNNAVSAGIVG